MMPDSAFPTICQQCHSAVREAVGVVWGWCRKRWVPQRTWMKKWRICLRLCAVREGLEQVKLAQHQTFERFGCFPLPR